MAGFHNHRGQGLLVALQNASPRTLIVVFTDNGSKDLRLEREIVRLRETKQCEVYIVLTPAFEGRINGKSLPSYGRMGQVGFGGLIHCLHVFCSGSFLHLSFSVHLSIVITSSIQCYNYY